MKPILALSLNVSVAVLLTCSLNATVAEPGFWSWAKSPSMGWNSWDCYGAGVWACRAHPPEQLVPDPDKAIKQLKLLYVSCGNKDGLISRSQGVHAYQKEKNVPHIYHVDEHAHDFQHWLPALEKGAR